MHHALVSVGTQKSHVPSRGVTAVVFLAFLSLLVSRGQKDALHHRSLYPGSTEATPGNSSGKEPPPV